MAIDNELFRSVQPPGIPAFSICGTDGAKRAELVLRLARELEGHGLQTAVLRREPSESGKYEPLTAVEMPGGPCDLILVDGEGADLLPCLWLDDGTPPPESSPFLQSFGPEQRLQRLLDFLLEQIDTSWRQTPVFGCVLIGGKSSRMGRPKHLLKDDRGVWLARTVALLQPLVAGLVLSGAGAVPDDLQDLIRLPDAPGLSGPLAGVLSAMRWHPRASWLVVACDMPDITKEALDWLLAGRRPGVWGTVPRVGQDGLVAPLFAHYDFRSRFLFEDLAVRGCLRVSTVAEHPKIDIPLVPKRLRPCWRNVNTPEELRDGL